MDSQLKTRELCIKNKVPEKEIFKLMTLKKVCEMIGNLLLTKAPRVEPKEEVYKLRKRIKQLEEKGVKNYDLAMENQRLKKELNNFWLDSNRDRVRYVEGIQKENLEYRTRNEKLIDEINAMRVKLADLKAKKLSVEQDYRLDKKRLKNLLKMGEKVDEAEVKSYKREVQQLKTTLATLRRGVDSRDKKIKAQGQELRMRATEISRLKKAVANSVLRKRK